MYSNSDNKTRFGYLPTLFRRREWKKIKMSNYRNVCFGINYLSGQVPSEFCDQLSYFITSKQQKKIDSLSK